jgi:hypothetical protein
LVGELAVLKERRQADRRFQEDREESLLKELQRCKDEEAERSRLQEEMNSISQLQPDLPPPETRHEQQQPHPVGLPSHLHLNVRL